MKIGDKIKFDFAGKKKEGTVSKLFDNTVYLKVDFNTLKFKFKIPKKCSGGPGQSDFAPRMYSGGTARLTLLASNAASYIFYGITYLIRPPKFAARFATFEESLR